MRKTVSCLLALSMILTMCVGFASAESAQTYPIVEEPVTYTALTSSSSSYADDFNEYTVQKYLTEMTNVRFDWQYISNTDWDTQVNLKLASGDLPDIIYGALNTSQLQTYGVEGGMFLNYAEHLDAMPNMAAAFEKYPDLKSYCTMLDGGIYSLAKRLWTYSMASPIYYRDDMMRKMDAKVPTTIDEFYELLVMAKEAFADVEGFYPIQSALSVLHTNLFPAFGDGWQVGYGDNGDGKVVYNYVSDQWRHYLEFLSRLYAEGMIDPEIFTLDGATINAKVKAGQCLLIGGVGTQLTADYYESGKIETKVLAPLVSEYTDKQKTLDIDSMSWCGRIINAECKNPEPLLKYLDMFYVEIPDRVNEVCGIASWLGIYGTDWAISEDGQSYYRILPEDTFGLAEEEYKNKYVIDSNYCGLVVLDLFPVNNPTQEMKAYESAEKFYPYMQPRLLDGSFKYTADENSELSGMVTDIDTYVATATAQFIQGTLALDDASWDNYVNTINSMNLSRVLELKQIGYDRWKGEE